MHINFIEDYEKQNVTARIALLGSPGSGKTTLSLGLGYYSKLFEFRSDTVPEIAKHDIYKGIDFSKKGYEQNKFNRQKKLEDIYPKDLEILIVDGPLIISAIYADYYHGKDSDIAKEMLRRAEKYKKNYTHFFVTRKLNSTFEEFGRNETEKQAEDLHHKTIEILEKLKINYFVINEYNQNVPINLLEQIGAIKKIKNYPTKN